MCIIYVVHLTRVVNQIATHAGDEKKKKHSCAHAKGFFFSFTSSGLKIIFLLFIYTFNTIFTLFLILTREHFKNFSKIKKTKTYARLRSYKEAVSPACVHLEKVMCVRILRLLRIYTFGSY